MGAYLQSKQLVHRDIKPGNIIVFGSGLDFKMADFGLSCDAHRRPFGFAGTPHYSSPKLLEYYRFPKNSQRPVITNAYKDDVYSAGMTADEVLQRLGFNWKMAESRKAERGVCLVM